MTELIELMKFNIIQLARHHRKTCEGEDCNISLHLLYTTAKKAGVKFSKKETEYFLRLNLGLE